MDMLNYCASVEQIANFACLSALLLLTILMYLGIHVRVMLLFFFFLLNKLGLNLLFTVMSVLISLTIYI